MNWIYIKFDNRSFDIIKVYGMEYQHNPPLSANESIITFDNAKTTGIFDKFTNADKFGLK